MDDVRFTPLYILKSLLVVSIGILISVFLHLTLSVFIKQCCKPVHGQTEEIEKHKNDDPPLYEVVVQNPPDYSPPEQLK